MAPSHLAREVGIVVRVRGIERRPHAFEPRPESEAHQSLEKQGKGRDEETRTRALEQVTGGAKMTKNIKNKPVCVDATSSNTYLGLYPWFQSSSHVYSLGVRFGVNQGPPLNRGFHQAPCAVAKIGTPID